MFQIKIASKPLVLIAADDDGVAFDSGRPLGVGEQVALDWFVGCGLHLYYAPVEESRYQCLGVEPVLVVEGYDHGELAVGGEQTVAVGHEVGEVEQGGVACRGALRVGAQQGVGEERRVAHYGVVGML